MFGIEGLDVQLDHAATAETQAEDNVVLVGTVVRDHARFHLREPLAAARREILFQAAAADRAGSLAIFTDDRPRPRPSIRGAVRRHDRGDDAALHALRGFDNAVDLVHTSAPSPGPSGHPLPASRGEGPPAR